MKILMVLGIPAVRTLGAARIQVELAEALRARGHEVDFLTGPDVYPRPPQNGVEGFLRAFPRASLPQLQRLARNYDVIDGLEGCVTASKATLDFEGVLVARSVGLRSVYERWRVDAERRTPAMRGRRVGRIPRKLSRRYALWEAKQSREHADGFFVPNSAERDELVGDIGANRVSMLPFGLSDDHRLALAEAAHNRHRSAELHVVFLGTWDARKGCYDFPLLVRAIRHELPEAQFTLLGTNASSERVMSELGVGSDAHVRVVPHFRPEELPLMLAPATVGVFPSYAEGLGFAVLEQLAAGIPVVAYDVPGPHDILAPLDQRLLVPPGDVAALARTILATSRGSLVTPDACVAHVSQYRWHDIAFDTIQAYSRWRSTS
jgi:glycosyltransferase involved in cell wall biosynthesis